MQKPFRTEHRKGLTGVCTCTQHFTENQEEDSGIKKGERLTVDGGISNIAIIAGCWVLSL